MAATALAQTVQLMEGLLTAPVCGFSERFDAKAAASALALCEDPIVQGLDFHLYVASGAQAFHVNRVTVKRAVDRIILDGGDLEPHKFSHLSFQVFPGRGHGFHRVPVMAPSTSLVHRRANKISELHAAGIHGT